MKFARRTPLFLLLASAALMVGIAACGGGDSDDDDSRTVPAVTATSADGNGGGPSVETIVVEMHDNFFEPPALTVPVGQTVTIVARNTGVALHNMVILDTEFKSDALVNAGDESTFEVTFSKAGEYDFQCDYHVPDMVGTITVQ
jgi:plastocyanin